MIYHSTRDEKLTAAPTRAVLEGIAPDGGLYVCDDRAKLDFDWQGTLLGEDTHVHGGATFWVRCCRTFRIWRRTGAGQGYAGKFARRMT